MLRTCLNCLSLLIPVLLNIAFFTLFERKILGISQSRKGPSKVSTLGFLQPFADAVKLFNKTISAPLSSNPIVFYASPLLALTFILWAWTLAPIPGEPFSLMFSPLVFLTVLSLNLYPLLLAGWTSNSKYAALGAMRGVAQTISYEISLALILFSFLLLSTSMKLTEWFALSHLSHLIIELPIMGLWLVSCVAETNRTPFDFAEGESELVSGFNVEYSSGGFALIFMAEYGSILFLSFFTASILTAQPYMNITSIFSMTILGFLWVWIRATYPRYRYDKLMALAWKSFLPIALFFLVFSEGVVLSLM